MYKHFPTSTVAYIMKDGKNKVEHKTSFGLSEYLIMEYLDNGYSVELYNDFPPNGKLLANEIWNFIQTDSDGFCGRI